ncbi:MAG: phosphotransferase [Clostridia bacterium]|nr:phosphotransferase [Clostridia bacterium]
MNVYVENHRLICELEGRMDSVNAAGMEAEILEALSRYPGLPLCLDAERLQYISSSGIRVLIRLFKACPEGLSVRNASSDVYDVFDVTGLAERLSVKKKYRTLSVEGAPIIGEGAFGTVYRIDGDTVVKVFRNGEASLPVIENEQRSAREAFLIGLPTAIPFDIVRVGQQYGAVYELIDARNCNDIVIQEPERLDGLIRAYADLIRSLHGLSADPGRLRSARDIYLANLDVLGALLPADVCQRLRALLEALPEDLHLVHGDIQMKNVMLSGDEMLLIDLDHICTGDPVFEFASLYAAYVAFNEDDPDNAMQFFGIDREIIERIYRDALKAYLGPMDEQARRQAEQRASLVGYLRFLAILVIELKDVHTELRKTQIRRATERLTELAFAVDDLRLLGGRA